MSIRRIVAVLLACATVATFAAPASAGGVAPMLPGIRPLGMGDAFVAMANDRNALHYNPAALAKVEHFRVSGIGIFGGIDQDFLDVIRFIQDNEEQFSDFNNIDQEFYDSLAPYDDNWVAADANAYMDVTKPGFGMGVYTTGRIQFKVDRGVYEPRVEANVFDDIVAIVGGSMDLGRHDLTVGASAKAVWRRETTRALTAREVVDFDPADILDDLQSADSGFGLDLGVSWNPPNSPFAAGAVLRDAPGIVGGESVGAALDIGGAWHPLENGPSLLQGLTVAMDFRDFFGGDAFGSKIHLGAELPLPVVAVRTGFNQGYPTVGLSLHSRIISLDYAFFGRELGDFPGAESQFMHAVEARLGF